MKLTISKNGRFVHITPKPNRFIKNGLRVYFSSAMNKYCLPIATTNIEINKVRYFLPKGTAVKIVKAELA